MPGRRKLLLLEQLEGRDLFAAFAVPWPEINSLRLSFVPDGTLVGDSKSELFQSLEKLAPNTDSQLAILKAFQTWAIETNSNIGVASDNGQPIGSLGFKQGDVRFGDIRIGAFKMEQDVLAVANPYDAFIANTWVGDVFLNSSSSFIAESDDPASTLYSIMLHEAGHVYGIGHSQDQASPMYPSFQSTSKVLTAADVAILRSIYGLRVADNWEGDFGNETLASATPVQLMNASGEGVSPRWHGDIGSHDDVDTFMVEVPNATSRIDIDLIASGISLLTAKLSVFNQAGEIVASSTAIDPRSNNLSLTITDLQAGERYYIQLESADKSVFGIGAYELEVMPVSDQVNALSPAPSLFGFKLPELAPEELLVTTPGYVEHTYYEIQGALTPSHPSQLFRVQSPKLTEELDNVFTIVMAAETSSIEDLAVSVTDSFGNSIPLTVIPSENGKLQLQVLDVVSGADYLITVYATDPSTVDMIYEIEVDFAQDGRQLATVVNNTLDASQSTLTTNYRVDQTGHYHFVLATSDWSDPNESGLLMRIVDANGQTRSLTQLSDGNSIWLDLFLDQGEYSIEFSSPNRLPSATVLFQLSAESFSFPIGPQLRDTSREPVESSTAAPFVAMINHWLPGLSVTAEATVSRPAVPSGSNVYATGRFTSAPLSTAVDIDSYFADVSEEESAAPLNPEVDASVSVVTWMQEEVSKTKPGASSTFQKRGRSRIPQVKAEGSNEDLVAETKEEQPAKATSSTSAQNSESRDIGPQASVDTFKAGEGRGQNELQLHEIGTDEVDLKDSHIFLTASAIYMGITLNSNRAWITKRVARVVAFLIKPQKFWHRLH